MVFKPMSFSQGDEVLDPLLPEFFSVYSSKDTKRYEADTQEHP